MYQEQLQLHFCAWLYTCARPRYPASKITLRRRAGLRDPSRFCSIDISRNPRGNSIGRNTQIQLEGHVTDRLSAYIECRFVSSATLFLEGFEECWNLSGASWMGLVGIGGFEEASQSQWRMLQGFEGSLQFVLSRFPSCMSVRV